MFDTLFDLQTPTQDRPVPAPIKAITVWQPWASLIAAGVMRHTTRDWPTDYRGPIAICAGRRLSVAGAPHELCRQALGRHWDRTTVTGAVLAIAQLTHCIECQHVRLGLTRADLAAGDFSHGRYAWRLQEVRAFKTPIPVTGRQGLFSWTPPDNLDALVRPIADHHAACRRIGWA